MFRLRVVLKLPADCREYKCALSVAAPASKKPHPSTHHPPTPAIQGKQENKVQLCKVVSGTSRSCLLACRRRRKLRSGPSCDRLREAPAKNSGAAKNKWPNSNRHAVESDCGHFLRAAEVSQRGATSSHSVPLATDGWSSRGSRPCQGFTFRTAGPAGLT